MSDEVLELLYRRQIANHRLTPGIIPPPRASEQHLMHFAGTFEGYQVHPHDLPAWIAEVLERHTAGERLEMGLTMSRAALFAFQRWDHFGGGFGPLPDGWMRCMRDLVERIRGFVISRSMGRRPLPHSLIALEDGLMDAYERFLERYAIWGGYRHHGWTDFPDTRNFQGPVVWSEADCAFRVGLELEREFPNSVHREFAIGKATRADYDSAVERRQRVDLVVSDLAEFTEDDTSQERFWTLRHGAFIETKWLTKGWSGNRFERDAVKRSASVIADAAKLRRHLALGRCQVAAVLVVDDEDYFSTSQAGTALGGGPDANVWQLIAGPRALTVRELLHD